MQLPENPLLRHVSNKGPKTPRSTHERSPPSDTFVDISFLFKGKVRKGGGVKFHTILAPHMMQCFVKTLDEAGGKTIDLAHCFK